MLSKDKILSLLLEKNDLWESETKHEAILLFKTLYEKSPELREVIINHVLKGPPRENVKEDLKGSREYDIFELLEYLREAGLELTESGKSQLEQIKRTYPNWKLSPNADISSPMHVGWHENPFTVEEIYSKKPREVAEMLRNYKDSWERSRWDLGRTVGATCRQHADWAIELFGCLRDILNDLPADRINPIILGLQLSDSGDEADWDNERTHNLLNVLEIMVSERPEAEFWTGLPSFLKNWAKVLKINANLWLNLGKKLTEIFACFDYRREEEKLPIEWFQRAINHPYGDLTQLYLEDAQRLITDQEKTGVKFELDSKTLDFFEHTIKTFALGSRYGVCILAHWLGWLEAVTPDWTEKNLVPMFYWGDSKERALVSWSGYLLNRTISRHLGERFRDTYLIASQNYRELGKSEQEGLIIHVAGLIWFKHTDLLGLKDLVAIIEVEGRRGLLEAWENHLEQAQKEVAEDFWRSVVIPYWNWSRTRYLKLPAGNMERLLFWKLLPFSHSLFPQAAQMAIDLAPSSIEDVYLFPKNLIESGLSKRYPEEFTNLFLAFIKADLHPDWHDEEWQQLWKDIKDCKARNLDKLKDELTKRNIKIEN